jgi:glycosyltransferase involved in cell wall biosynthesis
VVTRVGALDEIVLDGETGLVVPPEDVGTLASALARLLDDDRYARRLGTNGRSRMEHHHTWDAVVERMTPALERAAASAPPRLPGRFARGIRQRDPARR